MLGFFAYVPCYLAFWTIFEIVKEPLSTLFAAIVLLAICIPLVYFLLVLVYRAIT